MANYMKLGTEIKYTINQHPRNNFVDNFPPPLLLLLLLLHKEI
jgi:hypothetical protein